MGGPVESVRRLAIVAAFRLQDTPQPAAESTERITIATGVKVIIQKPTAMMICLAFAGLVFVNTGFLTWMPTFLRERFNLSLAQAGFASMFYHHAAAFIGVLLEGMAEVKRRINVPIAAGERLYSRYDYRAFLQLGCADFIQPDVSHAGGILIQPYAGDWHTAARTYRAWTDNRLRPATVPAWLAVLKQQDGDHRFSDGQDN